MALDYYNRLGYTLVLIGDVEELWEERPSAALKAYPRSYALECRCTGPDGKPQSSQMAVISVPQG